MNFPHPDQLVSEKDLERYTILTRRFWQERRRTGEGPVFIKLSYRCVRYRWGDVLKWLDQRKCTNTSSPPVLNK